jgi:ATP-dependent Clp protease adaptor protein ClpS
MSPTELLEPAQETSERAKLAPRWKVLLHDDPITHFDFVVGVLQKVFKLSGVDALRITREAHEHGTALVLVTTLEEGELYRDQVRAMARPRGYPLSVTLEAAD